MANSKTTTNKSVKEIQRQINVLIAQKSAIEASIKNSNYEALVRNILDLKSGIDIVEGDYYAPTRKYVNDILGVKNIRIQMSLKEGYQSILVKTTSPIGYMLPNEVEIDGQKYEIEFIESKSFSEELDY